jgi:hypothetical protein
MTSAPAPGSLSIAPYSPAAAPPERQVHAADSVGAMLAEAWSRLKERPVLLLGSFLAVSMPLDLILGWLNRYYFAEGSFFRSYQVAHAIEWLVQGLAVGALIAAAAPRSPVLSIGQALSRGAGSWARLLGAQVLAFLAVAAGFVAFILPAFYIALRLSLVEYAVTIEGRSPIAALRRSWELSEDHLFFLLRGNLVVGWLLPAAILFVPRLAYDMTIRFLHPELDHLLFRWLLGGFGSCLLAFSVVCLQCVFEDLARQEAFAETKPS